VRIKQQMLDVFLNLIDSNADKALLGFWGNPPAAGSGFAEECSHAAVSNLMRDPRNELPVWMPAKKQQDVTTAGCKGFDLA